jgi:hypothetical protein
MQIDQRAWVGIDVVKMQDLKAGQPFFTSVRYKNTGKTFALNCRIASAITMSKVTISSADDIKKDNQSYRFAPGKGTLYPGANNFIPFPGGNVVIIDQAIIDKIAAGELIIYIVGEIHYDDIFGDHHVTQFFKRYVPEANAFEEEAGGNDAD